MNTVLRALRRLSHKVGFDVRGWPPLDAFYGNLTRLFEVQGIDVVLDVGGNTGQYARNLRRAGYTGRIVSFEPASATHAALHAAAEGDPDWTVAPAMALGDHDGEITLNLFNRSDMNSLHGLSDAAKEIFPKLDPIGTEMVAMRRLDAVLADFVMPGETPFLKLDTQGAERAILDGAVGVLARFPAIQAEMSLVALYAGGGPFEDVVDFLRGHGFRMEMTAPVTFSQALGRQVEIDAVFVRRPDA
jgi:FkbM family methyltransferase